MLAAISKRDVLAPTSIESDINLAIGRRIRRRRRLLGMTQGDLAAVLGVQFQQVQKYECSINRISASRLHFLAAALGVPMSYFFPDLPNDVVTVSNRNARAVKATAELLRDTETRQLLDAYAKLPERVRRKLRALVKTVCEDFGQAQSG